MLLDMRRSKDLFRCSVAQSCLTLWDPMDCSTIGLPVRHCPLKFVQNHVQLIIGSVMLFNHLILSHPLLLLHSIFPNFRVFSNQSALCIRQPKYWSFSFSISPSSEYSGLISFMIDWFDLCSPRDSQKSLLQHHN